MIKILLELIPNVSCYFVEKRSRFFYLHTFLFVGTIEPKCDPAAIAQEAFENAQLVCEQIYMDSPKVNIKVHNMVTNTDEVDFVYIPGHLYHMFFEIFKNSMRATMEYHEDAEKVPDIDVLIAKSHHDITIKISDQV